MTEVERLRADAEERKYQRMIAGVAPNSAAKKKLEGMQPYQAINWATNFGTQVLVAFIGAFLLGYFFVETFVDPTNTTLKVCAGACCSFLTLLLETCLLMVHESKDEMIKRKNKEREEKQEKQRRQRSAANGSRAAAPAAELAADAERERQEENAKPK